jgi:hypothetical protein
MSTFIKVLQDKVKVLEAKAQQLAENNYLLQLECKKAGLLNENYRLRRSLNEATPPKPPSVFGRPGIFLGPEDAPYVALPFDTMANSVGNAIGNAVGGGIDAVGGVINSLINGFQDLLDEITRRTEPTSGDADPNTAMYNILQPIVQQILAILQDAGSQFPPNILQLLQNAQNDISIGLQYGDMNMLLEILANLSDPGAWQGSITTQELNMFQQAYYYLQKYNAQGGPIRTYTVPNVANPLFPNEPMGPGGNSSYGSSSGPPNNNPFQQGYVPFMF